MRSSVGGIIEYLDVCEIVRRCIEKQWGRIIEYLDAFAEHFVQTFPAEIGHGDGKLYLDTAY